MNQETDTKPLDLAAQEASRLVFRPVFCVDQVLNPPPIVRVPAAGIQIGRNEDGGLRLDDGRVSKLHATARALDSGKLQIVDERSKNGTFVNGQRVNEAELSQGDIVSIGDTSVVVSKEPLDIDDAPAMGLFGDSATIRRVRAGIRACGPTSLTVLLMAETGCGKELVARALHDVSGVRGDFVAVNCAAVPENLFESQFFGHKTGAFTGAAASHLGFFRAASEGTLFLDEVGELPFPLQSKLLRAIQERAVVPLGSTSPIPCPVRIVAATNRNLNEAVKAGTFRGDLLARLFEVEIPLPPLRERKEDILGLFLLAAGSALPLRHSLVEALLLHDWPYNVREVFAAARGLALAHHRGVQLDSGEFKRKIDAYRATSSGAAASRTSRPPAAQAIDPETLSRLLAEKGGSVAEVAREVGRSPRQVYRWIAKYGLPLPHRP